MASHRKKVESRGVQESPIAKVEVMGGDQTPKERSSNKMRFEGDHNESLIGDFDSMKGCQNEYPIQSRLNKSNASHETLTIDKKHQKMNQS